MCDAFLVRLSIFLHLLKDIVEETDLADCLFVEERPENFFIAF